MLGPYHLLLCFFFFTALTALSGQIAGTPDLSFGQGGEKILPSSPLIYTPEGKLMLIGRRNVFGVSAFVARFNTNGEFDDTFGVGGWTSLYDGNVGSTINSMLIKPDGKIPVGGTGYFTNPIQTSSNPHLLMIQLLPNGSYDPTFNNGGTVSENVGSVQSIVGTKEIILWRYLNDFMVGTHESAAADFQLRCWPNPVAVQLQLS